MRSRRVKLVGDAGHGTSRYAATGVKNKLGGDGVKAIAAWLWAVDCQACGKPLGNQSPALCVDDLTVFAAASLTHPECRASAWADGPSGTAGN
jgi:hypothetical protein